MRRISPRLVLALCIAVGTPMSLAAHPLAPAAGALGNAATAGDSIVLVKKGGGGKGHAKGHAKVKHAGKHHGHRHHRVAPRRVAYGYGHPAWAYDCHWHGRFRHRSEERRVGKACRAR